MTTATAGERTGAFIATKEHRRFAEFADAVLSTPDLDEQSPRDRHVRLTAERGRMGWQRATGHGTRNHAETTMARYKHLIGPKLRPRIRPAQQGEVALAVQVLNRMIRKAKPVSVCR